jgi:predicted naringenin-chalcone synthase
MIPTIVATSTAFPRFEYDQRSCKEMLTRWIEGNPKAARSYLSTLDTQLVERRAIVVPLEEVFGGRSFAARNDDYIRHAVELGERAVVECLARAGIVAGDVDHFITTSCTGFMIPSLDARLGHKLGMKRTLSRLPITEHGCAGGAVGLREAASHLAAHPGHRVLVLSVEIASLTFQVNDFSPENIISAGLFGDGAAGALVMAEPRPGRPRLEAAESRFFPDSLHLMGFNLTDTGLKIVLSREIPDAISEHAVPALGSFLDRHGLTPASVDHWLLHPGGRKIIESFEDAFDLGRGGLVHSRRILRNRGNLSSATVLAMLDDFFAQGLAKPGDVGVMVAFGPGFGAEMALLRF